MAGLVIRSFGDMYCVCDGVDENDHEYAIGTRVSDWYNSWEKADECRRKIYDIISQELQDAAVEFTNKSYEEASKYIDAKYDL